MRQNRWQDWFNSLLGLWMFFSPWILGFATGMGIAARTAWVLGAAIVVFAGIAVYIPKAWEEGLNIILGVCLLISPWALSYTDMAKPSSNAMITGLLVIIFAVWAMLMDSTIQRWWHERRQAH
jgi:SPW repeat